MAFTPYITCDNKNLTLEQLFNLLLAADADGNPVLKTINANDALTGNISDLRKTDLTNAAFAIKATAGNLLGWNIINPNASAVYVKFYNKVAGTVVVGTDLPLLTIMVKANDTFYQEANSVQREFSTAMSMRVTTVLADADNTAPGTAVHINVKYK